MDGKGVFWGAGEYFRLVDGWVCKQQVCAKYKLLVFWGNKEL